MKEEIIDPLHEEEEMKTNSDQPRRILESITDGFFALDPDWRFVYINGAAERLMGMKRETLLNKSHWEAYPATLGTPAEHHYRRSVHDQVPVEFEFFYAPKQRWYATRGYPTEEGGLSVFFRDVTERKAADDEQTREWRTFDAVLSNTPDHAFIIDPRGRFIYANRAFLELWHKRREDLTGEKIYKLGFPPELAKTLVRQVTQVARTGQAVRGEAEFNDLNEQAQCFEYILSPIFAANGTVEAIAGSSREITERKQAERLLGERARLNAMGAEIGAALTQIEQLPRALLRCAEALVSHLEAAFARIWTLAPNEDVLKLQASAGLYTHLDGTHARVPVGLMKIGLIAKERRPHLTNNVVRDSELGDPAWAQREGLTSFAGYPLVVEDRLVGVLAIFARRPFPRDTLQALESIANSIAIGIERKRAEEMLTSQTKELARSNADLQQFAYITSHDLQEPLRTMSNFSQIVVARYGTQLDTDAKEFLSYIVSGAQRMKELLDSLLTYSRVVNVETLPLAEVSLATSLEWASRNLQTVIEENGAQISNDPLPTVRADHVQLVQLFQNLIGNAIKYRKADERPMVHVSAASAEAEWVVRVRDNGIGIQPEHVERIFGVFKRPHGKEIPGTGIGLAICKRIVEKLGGRIWVESMPGEGSTFIFTLPR